MYRLLHAFPPAPVSLHPEGAACPAPRIDSTACISVSDPPAHLSTLNTTVHLASQETTPTTLLLMLCHRKASCDVPATY